MDALVGGCAVLLGALLVSAGIPKILAPRYAGSAVRRVVKRTAVSSDETILAAVRGLGGFEVALGGTLLLVGGPVAVAAAGACLATMVAFTVFVVGAIHAGSHCGCWASLTEGPAGGAELARSGALVVVASGLLAGRATGHDQRPLHAGATGTAVTLALVLLAAVAVVSLVGGRLAPVRAPRVERQLAAQRPPTALGRAGAWAAFLAGFVHAGTDAGRRRYALARHAPGRVSAYPTITTPRGEEVPWPTSRT
jgi:hypothetical protein